MGMLTQPWELTAFEDGSQVRVMNAVDFSRVIEDELDLTFLEETLMSDLIEAPLV